MRTEYHLFHILMITPKFRTKICAQWRTRKLSTVLSKALISVLFSADFIEVGVSCRIS